MTTDLRAGLLAAVVAALALAPSAAAVTVTRGPYLQSPTPGGVIVRWRTDVPTSSRVAIGPAPGSLATTYDDPLPVLDHVVTVNALTPDTLYYYAVGSTGGAFVGDDADHFFRTAPTTGTPTPFRIWTIGDAGFVGPNLDAVRDSFKTYNGGTSATDLFLLLGDNAYLTGTDAQYQAAVFDQHAEMLRTTPVYSTFGNHERFSSQDLTQTGPYFQMFTFPTAGEAGGVASGTESYYSFDYGNVHFVVLDSEDFAPASASGPMLTWLAADLAATTADWVIALWHRPPYSRGLFHDSDVEVNEIRMRQHVLPTLESHGIDLVLTGHSHSYERSFFLDGHYGLSSTFSSAFQVDAGDGDPAGDGAYRKAALGPLPNSGAVYVVNGSGSEVRNATLNHPAHHVGLLTLGSMVIDVDGNRLTARFLAADTGTIDDLFEIVKGSSCAPAPATGCNTAIRGKLSIRENPNPARSRWAWKWKGGTIDPADVGDPIAQTDVAVCVYDAGGALLGGQVFHGAGWRTHSRGVEYRDNLLTQHGFQKIKIRTGTPSLKAFVQAKAKGAGIGTPALPVTTPITAQLVNLDNGKCWSSEFTSTRKNQADRVTAVFP